MINKIAMLCLHSSPLDQPGTGTSGGMNVYVRELARALGRSELAVDVFTRSQDGLRITEDAPGVRVIAVPAGPPGPVAKADLADLAPALLHGIEDVARREQRYEVVHSHYWISGLVARWLAGRWSVPMVHMFHTLSRVKEQCAGSAADPRRARGEQQILDAADVVVVPNAVERSHILSLYRADPARLVTIPCGIDPAPFAHRQDAGRGPGALQPACQVSGRPVAGCIGERCGEPRPRFVVVALGRIERLKNFALLLRAVACACSRDTRFAEQVEVRLAGGPSTDEPEELPGLRRLAGELGIADRVAFLGAVPRAAVPALYAAADVCVVPSRHESFGLVALEAMAAGLPVVATGVGGLQVTVVDGVTGYLVPQDDPGAMAERLLALWSSPCLREALGVRGARAAQHFAWPVVAERVHCLYKSLAAGSGLAIHRAT